MSTTRKLSLSMWFPIRSRRQYHRIQMTHGFTLVELMVVLSIISLLIALLLPALGKSRDMSRQIQCATNQKQIGTVCFMYVNDWKDALPGGDNSGCSNSGDMWYFALRNYLTNGPFTAYVLWSPTLNCPVNTAMVGSYSASGSPYGTAYGPVVGTQSYYGACAGGLKSNSNLFTPTKTRQIPKDAYTPYWVELNNSTNGDGMNPSSLSIQLQALHSDSSNILFADSHVKSVASEVWNNNGGTPNWWAYDFALAYIKPTW